MKSQGRNDQQLLFIHPGNANVALRVLVIIFGGPMSWSNSFQVHEGSQQFAPWMAAHVDFAPAQAHTMKNTSAFTVKVVVIPRAFGYFL